MDPALDLARVEQLFHVVADLADEDAARILDRECQREGALRQAVERLLRRDRTAAPSFLVPNPSFIAEVVTAAERTGGLEQSSDEVLRSAESVGRFVVLKRLGAGAMAVVYVAYDEALDRRVALKVLRRGLALPEYLAREARALARLTHPNVVQVYEIGEHDGRPFIAMELVSGRSVYEWLGEQSRGASEILHLFVQAGRGLSAAHEAGLVHRDFKLDNVLIGTDGRVRVVDFGISALAEPGSESEGTVPGTPAYMAPEQFLGERASAASDQFAFCVSLYRALYGLAPFAGDDIATLRSNVVAGKPRAQPVSADLPAWVTGILARGLARQAGKRFPTMRHLLDAIERRLPAHPESDPAMGRRERRFIALAMGALGAAVLAALWLAHSLLGQTPSLRQFLLAPAGALTLQACAALVLRRQLLGNQFARKAMLVVWIGVSTVLMHRALALHFKQSVPQVLAVDLVVLGMEQSIAAVLFESWFGLTAAAFFVGAAVAVLWPAWAASAMLGSVVAAYALAATRV